MDFIDNKGTHTLIDTVTSGSGDRRNYSRSFVNFNNNKVDILKYDTDEVWRSSYYAYYVGNCNVAVDGSDKGTSQYTKWHKFGTGVIFTAKNNDPVYPFSTSYANTNFSSGFSQDANKVMKEWSIYCSSSNDVSVSFYPSKPRRMWKDEYERYQWLYVSSGHFYTGQRADGLFSHWGNPAFTIVSVFKKEGDGKFYPQSLGWVETWGWNGCDSRSYGAQMWAGNYARLHFNCSVGTGTEILVFSYPNNGSDFCYSYFRWNGSMWVDA